MTITSKIVVHVIDRDEQHVQRLGSLRPDGEGQPMESTQMSKRTNEFFIMRIALHKGLIVFLPA